MLHEYKKAASKAGQHIRLFVLDEECNKTRAKAAKKTGWWRPGESALLSLRFQCAEADSTFPSKDSHFADDHPSMRRRTVFKGARMSDLVAERRADFSRFAGDDAIIGNVLPLRHDEDIDYPYLDIGVSREAMKKKAETEPRLREILDPERDESKELSSDLLEVFNLPNRTYEELVDIVRFVRGDFSRWGGEKRHRHRSNLRSVASSLARRGWSRGKEHPTKGFATGLGFRCDQRGKVG